MSELRQLRKKLNPKNREKIENWEEFHRLRKRLRALEEVDYIRQCDQDAYYLDHDDTRAALGAFGVIAEREINIDGTTFVILTTREDEGGSVRKRIYLKTHNDYQRVAPSNGVNVLAVYIMERKM